MSVREIDEFISKDDWDRVWTQYVRPRQEQLWKRHGMKPQGRKRVDVSRLKKALPLYRKMVEADLEIRDILAKPPTDPEPPDQETLRRAIRDLQELLAPAPR